MKRLFFALTLLLVGCARYIPVTTIQKEIQYIDKYVRDSIYTADTTRIYESGDTIFNDRIKYIYIYKELRDTLFYHKTDSIPYPVEVVKTKSVAPKWAWATLGVSILFVVYIVVKIWKKCRSLRL